jgi:signal peptidase II
MTLVTLVGGIIVILDQAVKWIALHALPPGAPVIVIEGFFSLTLVMNPGLAFGMLGTVPPGWRWVVALLSVAAVGVLATIATRLLPEGGRVAAVAIGMIFGGAAGNLIDRARFGAVVDFLDFYWRGWHWPAFNVADSAISVGVALLALRMLTASPPQA